MKSGSRIIMIACILSAAALLQGCWTDLEQYEDFVCERFGGDADNDGVCSRLDCNDHDPFIYPGAPCDDGDPVTVGEVWTANCECSAN